MTDWKAVMGSALLFHRQKSRLPQTLIFFVTSRCNAGCDFCLYGEQVAAPVAREEELTVDEVERIAAQYGGLHYLALSGGEPFVRDDIEPICQAFVDRCGTAVVDIPSNFWFGERMVAALEPLARNNPDVVFDVQLSIDHIGPAHDTSRVVPGLYERARESARRLAEVRRRYRNLKMKTSVVVLERNADQLDAIVEAVRRDFDCDRVQLAYPNRLLPRNPEPGEAREVAAFREADRRIGRRMPARRLGDLHTLGMLSVKELYGELLHEAAAGARPTGSYCEAGRLIAVLDEKGEVFPCEPLWHSIGNVRDHGHDVGALLRGPAAQEFRARYLGEDACNCSWGCAMHSYLSASPRHFPRLGMEAAKIAASSLRRG